MCNEIYLVDKHFRVLYTYYYILVAVLPKKTLSFYTVTLEPIHAGNIAHVTALNLTSFWIS